MCQGEALQGVLEIGRRGLIPSCSVRLSFQVIDEGGEVCSAVLAPVREPRHWCDCRLLLHTSLNMNGKALERLGSGSLETDMMQSKADRSLQPAIRMVIHRRDDQLSEASFCDVGV